MLKAHVFVFAAPLARHGKLPGVVTTKSVTFDGFLLLQKKEEEEGGVMGLKGNIGIRSSGWVGGGGGRRGGGGDAMVMGLKGDMGIGCRV